VPRLKPHVKLCLSDFLFLLVVVVVVVVVKILAQLGLQHAPFRRYASCRQTGHLRK